MGLKDRYDFDMLVNEAEGLVLAELEAQVASTPGLCTCQDCVLDMAAFALNKVHPSYRASLMGSVYAKAGFSPGYLREISQAVREAVEKVRVNPSHD